MCSLVYAFAAGCKISNKILCDGTIIFGDRVHKKHCTCIWKQQKTDLNGPLCEKT